MEVLVDDEDDTHDNNEDEDGDENLGMEWWHMKA